MFEGWFSNRCDALVGEDGDMLRGEALLEAMRNGNAHRCGNMVPIGASFCNQCGAPAPGSWWDCKQCGRRIGSESHTCAYCGADQDLALRQDFVNGLWKPAENVFAERFELNGYRHVMESGLSVELGQSVILLDGGRVCTVLREGSYSLEELARLGAPEESGRRQSLFFVRGNEMDFPLQLTGLLSKENMPLELTLVATLQFDCAKAETFLQALVGNPAYVDEQDLGVTITMDSLAYNLILVEAELAAKDFTRQHTVDLLYANPELREELKGRLAEAMSRKMSFYGFALKRLSELEFHGEIMDRLSNTATGIETMHRELEYQLQADDYIKDHERRSNCSDFEQEEYLRRLAQRMKVSERVRDQELELLQIHQEQERGIAEVEKNYQKAKKYLAGTVELEQLEEEHKQKLETLRHNEELARKDREHEQKLRHDLKEQQEALDKAKIQQEIDRLQNDATHQRTMQLLQEREEGYRISLNYTRQYVEILNTANPMTLTAMAKTPAEKEAIREMAELQLMAKLTPEQIRAMKGHDALSSENMLLREFNDRLGKEHKETLQLVAQMIQRASQKPDLHIHHP